VALPFLQTAGRYGSDRRILLDSLFSFSGQYNSRLQTSIFGKEQIEFQPVRITRTAMPQAVNLNSAFSCRLDEPSSHSTLA